MNSKLHSDQGETLVETLASILIATLSVSLLFGAVTASARMSRTARGEDRTYYEALSRAERRETAADIVQLKVKNSSTGGVEVLDVAVYGGGEMYSYAIQEGP